MSSKKIHIISFNVPFPANYGGVIDVFYKIKSLHEKGVEIILHTFQYGRSVAPELDNYCEKVFYYPRPTDLFQQFSLQPFIVKTRNAKALLRNLQADENPILFEGLHTCFFLDHPSLSKRKKIVRMHNVEWQYYAHLAKVESNFLKKIYFRLESWKLKKYESKIEKADVILSISQNDLAYFLEKYQGRSHEFVPAFHSQSSVEIKEGSGSYFLFHGDLSVKDNEMAVNFLLENVAQSVDYQWIIAGLNPSEKLIQKIGQLENVELKANVTNEEMKNLIQNAHANALLSFQSAGMKLKLVNALFQGRFCVVNKFMVENSAMKNLCLICETPEEWILTLTKIKEKDFKKTEIEHRKILLENKFSNSTSAQKIIDLL